MALAALRLLATAFELIAPERCAGCGSYGRQLCESCLRSIASKRPVERFAGLRILALGEYDGILRRAVHALKYRNHPGIGCALGELLARRVLASTCRPEVVIPVPLHAARQRARGYNQAEVIARSFGNLHEPNALARIRATSVQARLDRPGREQNVARAFAPGPRADRIYGNSVVLVDDVVTTGATMRACAAILKSAGAAAVSAAAVAIRL